MGFDDDIRVSVRQLASSAMAPTVLQRASQSAGSGFSNRWARSNSGAASRAAISASVENEDSSGFRCECSGALNRPASPAPRRRRFRVRGRCRLDLGVEHHAVGDAVFGHAPVGGDWLARVILRVPRTGVEQRELVPGLWRRARARPSSGWWCRRIKAACRRRRA